MLNAKNAKAINLFLDHNVVGPGVAALGGFFNHAELRHCPRTTDMNIEILRDAVYDITVTQRYRLVGSLWTDETLRRLLVRGGRDIEALCEESAQETVEALAALSKATNTYVTSGEVNEVLPRVKTALADHYGHTYGLIGHEDLMVVATLVAAATDGTLSVLVTYDTGLLRAARKLTTLGVLVMNPIRFRKESAA